MMVKSSRALALALALALNQYKDSTQKYIT